MKLKRIHIIIISSVIVVLLSTNISTLVLLVNKASEAKNVPIIIWKDEDFESYGFPGKGTADSPYIIKKFEIITDSNIGIHIARTTKYFIIRDCFVQAGQNGILIEDVAGGTAKIENNICSNNGQNGIAITGSSESLVSKNLCENNGDIGIYIQSSSTTSLLENTCSSNNYGLSIVFSENSVLTENTCSENQEFGFYCLDSSNVLFERNNILGNDLGFVVHETEFLTIKENYFSQNNLGLDLSACSNCKINNNIFSKNNFEGIILFGSFYCEIYLNSFQESSGYAIFILNEMYISRENIIHHNAFQYDKLDESALAYDEGTANIWYSETSMEGNYWKDWSGFGTYSIDGPAGAVDLYPLLTNPL
jgi:parallel beta-helix repeat protein